jgi:hypothetical protein
VRPDVRDLIVLAASIVLPIAIVEVVKAISRTRHRDV